LAQAKKLFTHRLCRRYRAYITLDITFTTLFFAPTRRREFLFSTHQIIIMVQYTDEIEYSDKYEDDEYEYRHVLLPKDVTKRMLEMTAERRRAAVAAAEPTPEIMSARGMFRNGNQNQSQNHQSQGGNNKRAPTILLSEDEWRHLGISQSHGWQHYEVYEPEMHVMLFRRRLTKNNNYPGQNPY